MANNYTLIAPKTRLDAKDVKILHPTIVTESITYTGPSTRQGNVVQMHAYDSDDNHIVSVPNLQAVPSSSFSFTFSGSLGHRGTTFYTDVTEDVKNLGLLSGTYKVVYNFLNYYLTFAPLGVLPWYIQDISTSRREVRVITPTLSGSSDRNVVGTYITKPRLTAAVNNLYTTVPLGTFLLDLGDNNFAVVINQTVSGDALLFKLYKPLPDNIEEKAPVAPFFEMANPLELFTTVVVPSDEEKPLNTLKGPNTDVFAAQMYDVGTSYKSWDDLLSTDPQTSRDLLDHFLSSSNHTETINVDYSNFGNFVHFGSSEERVRNFQYKLKLLEQYDSTLGALVSPMAASGSTSVVQNVTYYSTLKSALLNGFDGYENWLYWESGSSYSSSLGFGPVTQSTWPKSTATYPYTLYSVTSSQGVKWFNNEVGVANTYDRNNPHNLLKTAPFHLREDDVNNESYLTFLQMIGQHYDLLWTFSKAMTQRYDIQHKLSEGAAKDVIWDTMKSLGMDLTNGNDVSSLWKYAFGTDVTGSYPTNILSGQNGFYPMSSGDATKEVWKRLFNNLPYLLKSKGTVRGVKALITCYGIPSTILRVKEYGGPDPDIEFETTKYVADEFTYALDFTGTQMVSQSWSSSAAPGTSAPNSVEFRFLIDPVNRRRMTLFEGYNVATRTNNFKLSVSPTFTTFSQSNYVALPSSIKSFALDDTISSSFETSTYATMSGYLVFEVSGGSQRQAAVSSEIPVYNGAYWSVLLERAQPTSSGTFNLWAKQALDGRIVNEASFTTTLNGALSNSWDGATRFAIGSSSVGGESFTGTMQEFRLWSSTLNEDVFDNHVLAPLAYNGNTYSSSYYDLVLRWRMNNAEFYTSGSYGTLMLDSNPTQTSTRHGYWSGTNSASVIASLVETNYYESPSIGFRRMTSNKVRVDSFVSRSGGLDPRKRVTVSKFDRAPMDSNKVGIFLAPTEIINEDIIRTFAGLSYDDFIGSPLDREKDSYWDLIQLNNFYWTKYGANPNIYTYMRVLSYFDKSLYGQIRKMLPARVDANIGFLFEPHMLERSKVVTIYPMSVLNEYYTASVNIDEIRTISSTINILQASESLYTLFVQSGNYWTYFMSQSLQVVPDRNPYSYSIITYSGSVSNNVLTIITGSFVWSATGSIVNPVCDFWFDSGSYLPTTSSVNGAITGYGSTHFFFHRPRFTDTENLYYKGCLQTILTTPDKGLPFETTTAPPNILTVVNAEKTKPQLKVE